MKTVFQAALALWANQGAQRFGLSRRIEVPADGGPADMEVFDALVQRIEDSDLCEAEKEDLLDRLALMAARFLPTDVPAGES